MVSLVSILFKYIDSPAAVALFLGIILAVLVIGLIFYIYLSFVFFSIGKKLKAVFPRLALIPVIGPSLIAYDVSRMHFWPFLNLLIFLPGLWFVSFVDLNLFVLILTLLSLIIFLIYNILWHTRMFRMLKRPGWWAFSILIPFVYVVFVGFSLKKPNYNGMKGGGN